MTNDSDHSVRNYMQNPVITARRDQTVAQVAQILIDNRIGSVVIVDENGDLCGLVSEEMFMPREHAAPFLHGSVTRLTGIDANDGIVSVFRREVERTRTKSVDEVMNPDPPHVDVTASIDDVINLIEHTGEHHIPVVENRKPVGIIARHDLMRLFTD